jgi:hypothetical protein
MAGFPRQVSADKADAFNVDMPDSVDRLRQR